MRRNVMSKADWKNQKIIIGPPNAEQEDYIEISALGEKDENIRRVMANAFDNALLLLKDAMSVSEYSRVILTSLSCELFLKAILFKTKNIVMKGHDIHELFSNLNQEEQDYLIFAYAERDIPEETPDSELDNKFMDAFNEFETNLMVNALCFETIRYKHELGAYIYNPAFITNFAIDLKHLGDKLEIEKLFNQ